MYAAVLKFDPSQARDLNGRWVRGLASQATSREAFLRAFDPAKKETWYRKASGWHTDPEGNSAFRYAGYASQDDPNYVPPTITHKVIRGPGSGEWGGSHYGSTTITGEAAAQMGIEGWTKNDATKTLTTLSTRMLQAIADDKEGSEEPLYHAFQNKAGTVFTPGDTMKLPLLASAGQPEVGYATRAEWENQEGAPTVFAFPKGTPMVAYGIWPTNPKQKGYEDGNAKDFGHVYAEAIVAGHFRVVKVETVYMGSQHSVDPVNPDDVPQLYGQVVHLEPIGVFNPATGKWEDRG